MTCPVCKTKSLTGIDPDIDGYSADLMTCDHCGAIWTHKYTQSNPALVNFGTNRPS